MIKISFSLISKYEKDLSICEKSQIANNNIKTMNTNKYIGIFASAVIALSVGANAQAACTIQTLNDCDQTQLMALVGGIMGGTTPDTTTTTTTTTVTSFGSLPAGFQFTKTLKLGVRDAEVKTLQTFLNTDAETKVDGTGAGSSGKETTYFGPATKSAVMRFQAKHGITPVAGYWGAISRAKANTMVAGTTPTTPVATGCANGAAFDPTTGLPCSVSTVPGCTTGAAFSSTTGAPCNGSTPVVVSGSLSVALASDNPAVTTLISTNAVAPATNSQSNADLAHFTFTNGSATEVKVTSIELSRLGISADAGLKNVYLFDGVTRLTDAGTVSSGKVTFNATSGIFTIAANGSKTISVKADIGDRISGQTIGVALSGVTSSAQLSATLPLNGNIHNVAGADLSTVTFGVGGLLLPGVTTSDPMNDVIVWQDTVTIGTRNVTLNKFALKQINSIEAKDMKNFRLVVDGTEVAKLDSVDSTNYLVFTNVNKTLTTGGKIVKVIADVIGGSGRIAQFSVRNKADIEFKDSEYNVLVAATNVPATAGTITINPGVMSVTKASTSVSGKVANNGSNVSIAKYEFKAYGEPVKIETLTVGFAYTTADGTNGAAGANNGTATLRNGKIYVNGAQVGSTTTIAKAGTAFTTNFEVTPGTTAVVEVIADIFDNDGAGVFKNADTMTASLLVGAGNATKQVSYGTLNVPSVASAANQVTVSEGNLTVGKTSAYANQNTVIPQNLYKVGSWDISGSATEDVNINTLGVDVTQTINAAGGNTFDQANLNDAYLAYTIAGGTAVNLTIKPTLVAANNNWPLSVTLAKNQTMRVDLYARISGTPDVGDQLRSDLDVAATGASSSAAIAINNTVGQLITVQAGGLNITRAASTPVSAIVDDSGKVITASYKFEAQNDAYTIEEVLVNIANVSAVSTVSLKDGATVIKNMPAAAAIVFGGLNIVVPANESKTLDIELELTTVGAGAGDSGAILTSNIQGAAAVSARSGATGISATINTAAIAAGNAIYAYKAYPSFAAVTLPTTILNPGSVTLSKFSVTANGGNIAWTRLGFNVGKSATVEIANTAAALDPSKISLVDTATGIAVPGTFTTGAGAAACYTAANTSCTLDFVPTTEESISGLKTYEVRATISGVLVANNYTTTEIKVSGAAYAAPIACANAACAAVASNIVWSDVSAQGHAYTTLDWNNDNLLKTLPISQTLTKN